MKTESKTIEFSERGSNIRNYVNFHVDRKKIPESDLYFVDPNVTPKLNEDSLKLNRELSGSDLEPTESHCLCDWLDITEEEFHLKAMELVRTDSKKSKVD